MGFAHSRPVEWENSIKQFTVFASQRQQQQSTNIMAKQL